MTLAVAYSLTFDPIAENADRSVFIAADSRTTDKLTGRTADHGAKVILLDPVPAVLAFAGEVKLGELGLALAAKLVRRESSPTLERIKELTLSAFKNFYRPGKSLWGLLGAVSGDGASDSIWSLGPHNGKEITAQTDSHSAMIGDLEAQAAYKSTLQKHWTSVSLIQPSGAPPVAVSTSYRYGIIFDMAIDEMHRRGKSTIGRPVQALLITKHRYWSFGGGKYNQQDDAWEQVHPTSGEVRFRFREPELRDLRRRAGDLRQRRPE